MFVAQGKRAANASGFASALRDEKKRSFVSLAGGTK